MSVLRKLLLTVMVLGATTSTVGAGTFASFNASTTNSGSTFSTGTLVLSDKVGAATACFSTGVTSGAFSNGNTNSACGQSFAVSVAKPGDSATVDVTIQDAGTISATALALKASQVCASTADGTQTFNGGADVCASVLVNIQRYSDNNRTTPSSCVYGGGTATTCDFTTGTQKTLADFSADAQAAPTGAGLSLGALTAGTASTDGAWFRFSLKLPTTAGNTLQGMKATFGFTWTIS